jgi:arginyl-tRNA synthetase
VVDVLGSDHKLAIDQLKIALELLGGKKPEVIFYEFITLPEGSMSTRKGVFISVDQLMDEAFRRAQSELKDRRPELNESLSKEIAEIIGIGAIRYFIARLSPEKHLVFKWDEALSFEKGCASIQYAHARACKLLEKASATGKLSVEIDTLDFSELNTLEIDLIKNIAKFTSIVENSARDLRVHPIAQYAMEMAGTFNKFYKSVQVIGSDKEILRLLLVDKSRITIKNCLNLLGIDAPNSM